MKNKIPWYAEAGSGKIGNKVYYKRNGKIFVRKAPKSYNIISTEKQAVVREKFTSAVQYAKAIISNPDLKAQYQKKARGWQSAYSVAISEYLNGVNSE